MMRQDRIPFDKDKLREDLKNIGLKKGDRLIVHSSLKSIGLVKGGADTILNLLMKTVGTEGAIAMPVFSYSFVGREGSTPFHPEKSPSYTGMLTEIFRKKPGVIRSLHPTHSVAVWGKKASFYVRNHEKTAALGEGSPFHKLARDNAKILLIGIGFTGLSLIHVGEALNRVYYLNTFCWQYLNWKPQAMISREDGSIEIVNLQDVPGCSRPFGGLEEIACQEGLVGEGTLGKAKVKIVSSGKLLDLIKDVLSRKEEFLLCPAGICPACDQRRRPGK